MNNSFPPLCRFVNRFDLSSTRTLLHYMSERKTLVALVALTLAFAVCFPCALAEDIATTPIPAISHCATAMSLKSLSDIHENDLIITTGFHVPGDGGGALYCIHKMSEDLKPNEADVISLDNDLVAVLQEGEAVNYRMFGVVGDGENDDGVQIKLAHEYAVKHHLPVINLSGKFWIKATNNIPITTNVSWGNTTFHIDERFNSKTYPRFVVLNDEPAKDLTSDTALKAALLNQIKPGVQIIPDLAGYAGHLVLLADSNDLIAARAGFSSKGRPREEFFYVEEEGRIIGDIAWGFNDFTSIRAVPCNNNYLIIQGGGFYFSGDTPASGEKGYHHHGFSIRRSRTIVREQWMGLEKGKRDVSLEPRCGFYVLSEVYDVTLENIRCMPWEKNRSDKEKAVAHGTYGLGGGRMLNCTFRNLTAEAGWVAWGVFGTNLNKNFRIEGCRLNRIDVHFYCMNLYINNCNIGFKGITVTGGGNLFVEDTTRDGNNFIGFRTDFGSRWDGRVRLRNCTLRPNRDIGVSVLAFPMRDFDYKYSVGLARTINIEDLTIDYSTVPDNDQPCWLMMIRSFSKIQENERLFFPNQIEFRNISVKAREQGVRLVSIPSPYYYVLDNQGDYDGNQLNANCTLICENVALEAMTPESPDDTRNVHLLIGGEDAVEYSDSKALFPKIRFTDCANVSVYLNNCAANAFFERCTINTVWAPKLHGELVFNNCQFQPNVAAASGDLYALDAELGTRFTNCTIHVPIIGGQPVPEAISRTGFLEINKLVRYHHLNTTFSNEVLKHCKKHEIMLTPAFISMLKAHHALEP